jgi:hypothetical protein
MISTLVQNTFRTRNAAQVQHWKTKSFSEHQALGEFYMRVISDLDSLVEAYQGVFDVAEVGELESQPPVKNIVKQMESDLLFIAENRAKITGKMPALDNLLQTLEEGYMTTIYKLRRFG